MAPGCINCTLALSRRNLLGKGVPALSRFVTSLLALAVLVSSAGALLAAPDLTWVGPPPQLPPYARQFAGLKPEPIFNGRNLDGWTVVGGNKNAFYVRGGAILCNGRGGWWLRYERPVADFILSLKYVLSRGANSGVFIRCTRDGDPPWTGWEVQILDTHGQQPTVHSAGAIYDIIKPRIENSRPAFEWNEMQIVAHGAHVEVWLNGEQIIEANLDEYDRPIGKFSVPLKELPRSGYIGFQDHGCPLAFKDIYLTELPPAAK